MLTSEQNTELTTSRYVENQLALASSPGGVVAASADCGDRFRTETGEVVTVWLAWRPDVEGRSEAIALKDRRPFDSSGNSEIGITTRSGTARVNVTKCASWARLAP